MARKNFCGSSRRERVQPDRRLRLRHHPLARIRYRSIVISANNHRAGFDHGGDAIDNPARIRTVAHEVAEKDVAVDLRVLGVGKAGSQGLAVGVDVGEEGDQHDDPGALGTACGMDPDGGNARCAAAPAHKLHVQRDGGKDLVEAEDG